MSFEELVHVVSNTLNCDAQLVTPEAGMFTDLSANSLDAVELSMAIEDACGVSIADDQMVAFKSVGQLHAYIQEHAA